jgi:hypothetical protein
MGAHEFGLRREWPRYSWDGVEAEAEADDADDKERRDAPLPGRHLTLVENLWITFKDSRERVDFLSGCEEI